MSDNFNFLKPATADPNYYGQAATNASAYNDLMSKYATARAYQQATDPTTGQVDPVKFNALITQNPQSAWNAGPIMQQQGQAQAAQGQGVQEQVAAHRARMSVMMGLMNGLVSSGKPISQSDISDALNQAHLSPAEAQTITQDANTTSGGNPNFDFTSWVKGHMTANLTAQEQIARVTPNMQFVSTPNGIIAVDTNPNTTKTPPGSVAAAGLAPNTQTTVWDPEKQQWVPGYLGPNAPGGFTPPSGAPAAGGGGAGNAPVLPRNTSMTAGQQGNNSGNLMVAQGGALPPGATGVIPVSGGRYVASFPDAATGIAAQSDNLAAYQSQHGINTIRGAVARWVSDPKADITSYVNDIAKAAKVDPDAPVDLTDPNIQRAFFLAQQPHESGSAWLKPADVDAGIAMAQARRTAGPGGGQPPPAPNQAAGPAAPSAAPAAASAAPAPAAAATAFRYPNGKVGGAPDANGGVQYADGTYGTPPAGPRVPITAPAAAPPARPAPAPAAAPPVAPPAAPPAAAPPAGTPPGFVPSGPPLGTGQKIEADIAAYSRDANAVAAHQNAIVSLQHAYQALQIANTGPGTADMTRALAFLQSTTGLPADLAAQPTNWALAHKYLMDYARQQGLAGGTDFQSQLSLSSNASVDIPKAAAMQVVRNNIAKERMAIAQVQDANGATGYLDYSSKFPTAQDQDAYQADLMPPEQLRRILALPKDSPAFKKYQASLDIARKHGLILDDDLAAQNQRLHNLPPQ